MTTVELPMRRHKRWVTMMVVVVSAEVAGVAGLVSIAVTTVFFLVVLCQLQCRLSH
jgi:hypothetical protein